MFCLIHWTGVSTVTTAIIARMDLNINIENILAGKLVNKIVSVSRDSRGKQVLILNSMLACNNILNINSRHSGAKNSL